MSEPSEESTFAPGQDMSSQDTEMSFEDMIDLMEVMGSTVRKEIEIHYKRNRPIELGGHVSKTVQCDSIDIAMRNVQQLSKSGSIDPSSIKIISYTIITTPRIQHEILATPPPDAPIWKVPAEHPYIPKTK